MIAIDWLEAAQIILETKTLRVVLLSSSRFGSDKGSAANDTLMDSLRHTFNKGGVEIGGLFYHSNDFNYLWELHLLTIDEDLDN
jgi:hypothetical protein